MNSSTKCKHRPVHEIKNRLYPDYDDGLFQRMYIEVKGEVAHRQNIYLENLNNYLLDNIER